MPRPTFELSGPFLDVHNWKYVAEGAKNLVVAYIGPSPDSKATELANVILAHFDSGVAMRLVKRDLADTSDTDITNDDDDEADGFRDRVILPLLYPNVEEDGQESPFLPYICTAVVSSKDGTCSEFLETLGKNIESERPGKRRSVSTIDTSKTSVRLTENLTGSGSRTSNKAPQVVSFEIKPKWGFLPAPNLGHKSTHSRYRMHRVLKASQSTQASLSLEEFNRLYDPLDLYSVRDADRQKAIESLVEEWLDGGSSNNLRVFCGGDIINPSEPAEILALARVLTNDSRASAGQSRAAIVTALTDSFKEAPAEGIKLFQRLAQLQCSFDGVDVELLANRWEQETGLKRFGGLHEPGKTTASPEEVKADEQKLKALVVPPTVDEYAHIVKAWLSFEGTAAPAVAQEEGTLDHVRRPTQADRVFIQNLTLRQAVMAYLLGATFKDCSVFVRTTIPSPEAANRPPSQFKVVDLDPKPLGRMPHYLALDRKIVAKFGEWVESKHEKS